MRLSILFCARLRASIKDIRSFLFLFLAAAVALSAAYAYDNSGLDKMRLALVNEDTGKYGQLLAADLGSESYLIVSTLSRKEALLGLRRGRYEAVLVIKETYSSSIESGSFENILDLFSTPASGAGITVSEPAINKTIEIWMAEFVRLEAISFLGDQSESFTEAELKLLEQTQRRILSTNPSLQVLSDIVDSGMGANQQTSAKPEPESLLQKNQGVLAASTSWYAVFCLFYLQLSSLWFFDFKNSRLLQRAARSGRSSMSMIAVSASVSFLLALTGYFLVFAVVTIIYRLPLGLTAGYLPSMLIYLSGSLTITLFVSSIITSTATLLFLAPVVAFVNAALSGLIYPLPEWAVVLRVIASAMPGKWLSVALSGSRSAWIGGLLCSFVWLLLGAAARTLAYLRDTRHVSIESTD